MPDRTFTLDIVTPERSVISEEVISLVVPAVDGYLGVLAGHAPLMTELRGGDVRARSVDGAEIELVIGGGFMDVAHGRAVILADSADTGEITA